MKKFLAYASIAVCLIIVVGIDSYIQKNSMVTIKNDSIFKDSIALAPRIRKKPNQPLKEPKIAPCSSAISPSDSVIRP